MFIIKKLKETNTKTLKFQYICIQIMITLLCVQNKVIMECVFKILDALLTNMSDSNPLFTKFYQLNFDF